MKQGCFMVAGFALTCAFLVSPLAAQRSKVNYQAYFIDDFDGASEDQGLAWRAAGSKFITKGFPILKYFEGMPQAVRMAGSWQGKDKEARFIGVECKFNRQGNNWLDLIPTKGGSDYEIPLRGVVSGFEVWVWGAGYQYSLEALVRDCTGRVHTLPIGNLDFQGWKNLSVSVPTHIPQTSRYLGSAQHLSFVGFRIRTSPSERVDDFYVFFDQFKALANMHIDFYDGHELRNAQFKEEGESGK